MVTVTVEIGKPLECTFGIYYNFILSDLIVDRTTCCVSNAFDFMRAYLLD